MNTHIGGSYDGSVESSVKKNIARNFGNAARIYDDVAQLQYQVGYRLIERLRAVKFVKTPQVILDLGAGTGHFSSLLTQYFGEAQVIALDIAQPMLIAAQQRALSIQVCADFDYLPLAVDSVDIVYSNMALQWSFDLPSTLRAIQRVLKKNGVLLFSLPVTNSLHELRASWRVIDDKSHVNEFVSVGVLQESLQQMGYQDCQISTENCVQHYATVYQLLHALKAVGANYVHGKKSSCLTGKQRLQQLTNAYEQYRDPIKGLPVSYEIVYGCVTL